MKEITSEKLEQLYVDFFKNPTKLKQNQLYKSTMLNTHPKYLKFYYEKIMLYDPTNISIEKSNSDTLVSFYYSSDRYISLYIKENGLIIEHDNIDLFDINKLYGMLILKKENYKWEKRYISFDKPKELYR